MKITITGTGYVSLSDFMLFTQINAISALDVITEEVSVLNVCMLRR
jgi:UDP-glucose 6-dehydrogenase